MLLFDTIQGTYIRLMRYSQANTLTTLVRLPGIVINASQLSSRATELALQCKGCRSVKHVKVPGAIGGERAALPRRCDAYVL